MIERSDADHLKFATTQGLRPPGPRGLTALRPPRLGGSASFLRGVDSGAPGYPSTRVRLRMRRKFPGRFIKGRTR